MRSRLFLLAVSLLLALSAAQSAGAQGERHVWAFYLGFWAGGNSWGAQNHLLSDRPAIGDYDSRDGGVAAIQIEQAQSAGINGFVVSWFGIDDGVTTTPALNNLLDRAAERGFGVGAALDVFDADFNRRRGQMVNSLNWLIANRVNHPGYLRYQGKPVIFFAFQERTGFSDADWQAIRNETDPNRNTLWIAEGLGGCCLHGGAMDGMYAFNLAWANGAVGRFVTERNAVQGRGGLYIPTVHPGWDENLIAAAQGRPNPTSPRPRNNGQFLATSFNNATTIGSDIILIVSWNEFLENSHIEPSINFGNQSLDTLRPLIAAWRGNAPLPAANSSPEQGGNPAPGGTTLTPTVATLNVRSGAGTNFDRIGQIRRGEVYGVTGETGGWFIIDFNGQQGFVSGQFVAVSNSGDGGGSAAAGVPTGITYRANFNVNMRQAPNTSSPIVAVIPFERTVDVVGRSGDSSWVQVNFNNGSGWVSARLGQLSGGLGGVPVTG